MHIDSYSFGRLVIDGRCFGGDVLIVGEKIINWWRKEGHRLQVEDLEEVWKYKPVILIIGQGASGVMSIDERVTVKCSEMNIDLIAGYTDKMVKEFNKKKDSTKIACGLHLTC